MRIDNDRERRRSNNGQWSHRPAGGPGEWRGTAAAIGGGRTVAPRAGPSPSFQNRQPLREQRRPQQQRHQIDDSTASSRHRQQQQQQQQYRSNLLYSNGADGAPAPSSSRSGKRSMSRIESPPPRTTTFASTSGQHLQQQQQQQQSLTAKRRRVRSILFLALLAFAGILVLDGLVQFTDLSSDIREEVENAVEIIDGYERRLVDGRGRPTTQEDRGRPLPPHDGRPPGLLRRLMDNLMDDMGDDQEEDGRGRNFVVPPHHRSYADDKEERDDSDQGVYAPVDLPLGDQSEPARDQEAQGPARDVSGNDHITVEIETTTMPGHSPLPRELLHHAGALRSLPLIPKHALQHRRRRELVSRQLPIPDHLREGAEDELYHAEHHRRRRRMYPVEEDWVADARVLQERDEDAPSSSRYETAELYQGYGTHYVDLWVGSPVPQRQTVIVDTGSSVTAFPCTGCVGCGSNPATGRQYHVDDDFDIAASDTYEEKSCETGTRNARGKMEGRVACDLGRCGAGKKCVMAVSYAEGSSWTASEGSDVVYPAGKHDEALTTGEQRAEAGVGVGMGSLTGEEGKEEDFDWMSFRLKFGCQSKVTGMFQRQLEDGIMGMDNRKGSFWLQLHEHYKQNGYVAATNDDDGPPTFDPAQFSLCYDRQPLSMDLRPGVGSGALTLGGTDPLLHNTDMVYAANVTPKSGWYSVRIKAAFLRTGGGTLGEPTPDASAAEYLRVNVQEHVLNGSKDPNKGVILDSGTTDTYLPQGLKQPFERAWSAAGVGGAMAKYHNDPEEMTADEVRALPTMLLVLQGHSPSNNANGAGFVGMAGSHEAMFAEKGEPQDISESDVVVAIPPTHYMEESRSHPGKYAARVYFTERYGGQAILGSNAMMGHEVNFDAGRARLGFSESHCDYERYSREREEANARLRQQQEEEIVSRVGAENQAGETGIMNS